MSVKKIIAYNLQYESNTSICLKFDNNFQFKNKMDIIYLYIFKTKQSYNSILRGKNKKIMNTEHFNSRLIIDGIFK